MYTRVQFSTKSLDSAFFARICAIAARRFAERGGVTCTDTPDAFQMQFEYDGLLHDDGYRLSDRPDGGICIASDSKCGLIAGLGRFLRDSTLYPERGFVPGGFRGEEFPEKPFRGMYFATHFNNFYNDAPMEEIHKIMEDLALWGQNVLCVWYDFHHYASIDDPASVEMITRLKDVLCYTKELGLQTLMTTLANEMFQNSPEALRADWEPQGTYFRTLGGHFHLEVCPSKPGGLEAICKDREAFLKAFADVAPDYYLFWPYDQGGCTCSDCAPWGANGFLRTVNALHPLVKQYFPQTKFCLSAWYFDRFVNGEWEAFRRAMQEGDYAEWISYIVAFFPEGGKIPDFILKEKNIAGIPLIDFPEISMYGATPWGGFGSNATPNMFTNIWDRTGSFLHGGFPYSEGIFEDINKAIMFSFYFGRLKSGEDIVREYVRFEFSPDLVEEITEIILLQEGSILRVRVDEEAPPEGKTNYRFVLNYPDNVDYTYACAKRVDTQLDGVTKKCWRWRIVYLRAAIDYELLHNEYYISAQCEKYLEELTDIYFAQNADYVVAPPTPKAVTENRGIA